MSAVPLTDLSDFLKSRRDAVSPADAGVRPHGVRKVKGLRREELADLAGLSVDYYTRLEQGRAGVPSRQVRAALARALALDESERHYLDLLVEPAPAQPLPETPRAELVGFVRRYPAGPAYMFDPRLDIVVANDLARAVLFRGVPAEFQDNMARWIFLGGGPKDVFVDWRRKAEEVSGILRFAMAERRNDPRLLALIAELGGQPSFVRIWRSHIVLDKNHGSKLVRMPGGEEKALAYETFQSVSDPGYRIVLHTVEEP